MSLPVNIGLLMAKELKYLYGAIDNPKRPLAAVIGE
jgi:3-phosphoglycerate kinase